MSDPTLKRSSVSINYTSSDGHRSTTTYSNRGKMGLSPKPEAPLLDAIEELSRLCALFGFGERATQRASEARARVDAWRDKNGNQPPETPSSTQVLDPRGLTGRAARIREIRAMAGRAMLDGPHTYKTEELEGPLLDLAVSKAVGVEAVIAQVDNAIAPFFECCVLNGCGRLQHQYMPSRLWTQGGPLVEEHGISIIERGGGRWAADIRAGWIIEADTPLLASMRALVGKHFGESVWM